ncbi:MAG: HAMP domain-containing histidine kinase [Lachnospiraceae bacterium]|nr:HAMP domain-containing histidine kinase [Lachnospiraceae bacterium]
MKRSIFKNLRAELVIYSVLSMILAVFTEGIIIFILSIIGSALGISSKGYGREARNIIVGGKASSHMTLPDYHAIKRWNRDTIMCIILLAVAFAVIFFIMYFLILTRGIIKDMEYISTGISQIVSGDMKEKIKVDRDDEIGEIAVQVNKMSDDIKRLMESEREALQTNKDMITCVAHDLRTPLTSVLGYLQLATDTEKYSDEERQHYAHIAMKKANRLQGLIEELFSYTKLMSGEITLHLNEIDIVKLVEQMIEEFYPLFNENNLECTLRRNIDSLILNVDGELMARAVQNLISNAIKYGKDGKRVFIELEKFEHEVQIRVTNFGLVIPQESIGHIFDKFYRVEESRSSQTGGSGLGLNIAQQIAVLHGGTIDVTSGSDGTCFTIAIPL